MRTLMCLIFWALVIATPTLAKPTLAIKSGAPGAGPIVVEVGSMTPEIAYWITLVPSTLPIGEWKQYHYFAGQTNATVTFDGVPGGDYQVRLHDRSAGYPLYAVLDVAKAAPQATTTGALDGTETITLLSEPYLNEPVRVSLTGLNPDPGVTYWITLIEADEPVGRWRSFHYITGQSEADVVFEKQPRSRNLELRLHQKMQGEPLLSVLSVNVAHRPPAGPASMTATAGPFENGRFRINVALENLSQDAVYSVQVANTALPVGYYVATSTSFTATASHQARIDVRVPGDYALRLVRRGQTEAVIETDIKLANTDQSVKVDPCANLSVGDSDSVARCLTAKSHERWSYQLKSGYPSCNQVQMDLVRAKLSALNAKGAQSYPRGFEALSPIPVPSCVEIADAARLGLGTVLPWTSCARSLTTTPTIDERVSCMESLRNRNRHQAVDLYPTKCIGVEKLLLEAYGRVLDLEGGSKETLSLAGFPIDCDAYGAFMDANERFIEEKSRKELLAAQAEAEKAREKNWLAREIESERAFWRVQRTGEALLHLRNAVHPADQIDETYVSDALITALHFLEPRGTGVVHSANGLVSNLANQMVFHHGVRRVQLHGCKISDGTSTTAVCSATIGMVNFIDFPNESAGGVLGAFLTGMGGQGPRDETFDLKLRHDGKRWQIAELTEPLVNFLLIPPQSAFEHSRPDYSPEECVWMQSVGFNPC
ncbi:hypothetical protein [Sedimentitalea todarodis]|uniref:CARDB domain-containing protein n=1 Tax=Sedimentitalea todarodis TaxID=1631240 RepID=A0ABU3VA99_9RHOB|nr:hypothetical protein [Sedimentitalea todarodis]MDU9003097.1 hypothetical protein [Sedimentitalea todarodis]